MKNKSYFPAFFLKKLAVFRHFPISQSPLVSFGGGKQVKSQIRQERLNKIIPATATRAPTAFCH